MGTYKHAACAAVCRGPAGKGKVALEANIRPVEVFMCSVVGGSWRGVGTRTSCMACRAPAACAACEPPPRGGRLPPPLRSALKERDAGMSPLTAVLRCRMPRAHPAGQAHGLWRGLPLGVPVHQVRQRRSARCGEGELGGSSTAAARRRSGCWHPMAGPGGLGGVVRPLISCGGQGLLDGLAAAAATCRQLLCASGAGQRFRGAKAAGKGLRAAPGGGVTTRGCQQGQADGGACWLVAGSQPA